MIRTRFAPSPTGYLHIGGLRTALYNYLFARKNNGQFLLRIEDTDQKRYIEGATENLINTLKTLGLDYDEGPEINGPHAPYFQSQRTEIYQKYANELIEKKTAYRCFCTEERLKDMRENQQKRGVPTMYDRHCLTLSDEEIQKNLENKIPFVIRLKIPSKEIRFTDIIRGTMKFDSGTIDDQVLMKSDGFPTYHLANVIDDHLMEISHVIRGEEWLPSTPKHIVLYGTLGWQHPQFAHIPLLLNPDKSKLSKRQGDVAAEDYLRKGYLKDALLNFIALLGWHPGKGSEQEIFSKQELIEQFELENVQKAGAIFQIEKLDWINGKYIRELDADRLLELIIPYFEKEDWFNESMLQDKTYIKEAIKLEQERLKTLSEAPQMFKFFLIEDLHYETNLFVHEKMKVDFETAKKALEYALPALERLDDYSNEEKIKLTLTEVIEHLNLKTGQLLWPIRVALTGEKFSPGVFELINVMGKKRTIERIKRGIEKL